MVKRILNDFIPSNSLHIMIVCIEILYETRLVQGIQLLHYFNEKKNN
jgi:hypothetical protein